MICSKAKPAAAKLKLWQTLKGAIYSCVVARLCLHVLQEIYSFLAQELKSLASAHGERLLHTPHNPISLGKLGVLVTNWFECCAASYLM